MKPRRTGVLPRPGWNMLTAALSKHQRVRKSCRARTPSISKHYSEHSRKEEESRHGYPNITPKYYAQFAKRILNGEKFSISYNWDGDEQDWHLIANLGIATTIRLSTGSCILWGRNDRLVWWQRLTCWIHSAMGRITSFVVYFEKVTKFVWRDWS